MLLTGPQALEPSSPAYPDTLTQSWVGGEGAGTQTGTEIGFAGMASGGLTLSAAMVTMARVLPVSGDA